MPETLFHHRPAPQPRPKWVRPAIAALIVVAATTGYLLFTGILKP